MALLFINFTPNRCGPAIGHARVRSWFGGFAYFPDQRRRIPLLSAFSISGEQPSRSKTNAGNVYKRRLMIFYWDTCHDARKSLISRIPCSSDGQGLATSSLSDEALPRNAHDRNRQIELPSTQKSAFENHRGGQPAGCKDPLVPPFVILPREATQFL